MTDQAPDFPRPDQDRGTFVILDKIGQGGSATVYRAHNATFNGVVALKVWNDVATEDQRRRFFDECSLQWQLSGQPNIVRLFWADAPADEPPWLATELYDHSLAERLRNDEPLTRDEAYRWAEDILTGLSVIHQAGHLHRDVKPANVLIKDGRAALADLGIAMAVDAFTADNTAGTPLFVAPELSRGENPTFRSDVFSAAVTINGMLPGSLSGEMEALLDRGLSHHPGDRPQDGADFLARFRAAAGVAMDTEPEAPVAPLAVPPPPAALTRPPRRRLLVAIGAGVLTIGATTALILSTASKAPLAVGDDLATSASTTHLRAGTLQPGAAGTGGAPGTSPDVASTDPAVASVDPTTEVIVQTDAGGAVVTVTTTYAGAPGTRTSTPTTTAAPTSAPQDQQQPAPAPQQPQQPQPQPQQPQQPQPQPAPEIEVLPESNSVTPPPVTDPPVIPDPPPPCTTAPVISGVPTESADPNIEMTVDAPCEPASGIYRVMVTELLIEGDSPHSEFFLQTKGDWNVEHAVTGRKVFANVTSTGPGQHRNYFIVELDSAEKTQMIALPRTANRAGYQGAEAEALFNTNAVTTKSPNVWTG